jgi:hypothetical protein
LYTLPKNISSPVQKILLFQVLHLPKAFFFRCFLFRPQAFFYTPLKSNFAPCELKKICQDISVFTNRTNMTSVYINRSLKYFGLYKPKLYFISVTLMSLLIISSTHNQNFKSKGEGFHTHSRPKIKIGTSSKGFNTH